MKSIAISSPKVLAGTPKPSSLDGLGRRFVLRRLEGFVKVHADYSKRYTDLHAEYDDIRKENRLTTAERKRFVT